MIRILDLVISAVGLVLSSPLLVVICLLGLFDTGAPVFMQRRVGRHRQEFTLLKFRTMRLDTVSVASHEVSATAITRLGRFLRRSKLDELPQLWNVLRGDMSLVGPRPCLPSQHELIEQRQARGVFDARPGITGLAQLSGIDMSTPRLLAETDARMLRELSLPQYFRYIVRTALGQGAGDAIK
jgi:O-antigen biosynthesis protein WbqP